MHATERTSRKWKALLLAGRPLALLGMLLAVTAGQSDERIAIGVMLVGLGFVVAWAGKLGAFWFHG